MSIVMPVRNEEANLERVVDACLAQDYPGPIELVADVRRRQAASKHVLDGADDRFGSAGPIEHSGRDSLVAPQQAPAYRLQRFGSQEFAEVPGQVVERLHEDPAIAHLRESTAGIAKTNVLRPVGSVPDLVAHQSQRCADLLEGLARLVHRRLAVVGVGQ